MDRPTDRLTRSEIGRWPRSLRCRWSKAVGSRSLRYIYYTQAGRLRGFALQSVNRVENLYTAQVADSWGFSGNHAKYRSGPLQFAKCLCPICWAFAVGTGYAYILLQARILPLWAARI